MHTPSRPRVISATLTGCGEKWVALYRGGCVSIPIETLRGAGINPCFDMKVSFRINSHGVMTNLAELKT